MQAEDFPDDSWQRNTLDAAVSALERRNPMIALYALSQGDPSGHLFASIIARTAHADAAGRLDQIDALAATLTEFYEQNGGYEWVSTHHPLLVKDLEGGPRGPGRPRVNSDPSLEPAPIVMGAVSPYQPPRVELAGDPVMRRIEADMYAFTDSILARPSMLGAIQTEDTMVRMFTIGQLAALFEVTPQTLTNWRKLGYGPPAIVVGGRSDSIRYPVFRVVEWLVKESEPTTGTQLDTEL